MGSLMYSGHVGRNTYKTEYTELLTPKELTAREKLEVAELRRNGGEFTKYMDASIQKNVNIKATGHAPWVSYALCI